MALWSSSVRNGISSDSTSTYGTCYSDDVRECDNRMKPVAWDIKYVRILKVNVKDYVSEDIFRIVCNQVDGSLDTSLKRFIEVTRDTLKDKYR